MSDVLDEGPFFHGTKADLRVGDLLTAGFRSNYRPEIVMNHIYFTALRDGAGLAAELAPGEADPRVYLVEPTGAFENDPNVTDKKFPGKPSVLPVQRTTQGRRRGHRLDEANPRGTAGMARPAGSDPGRRARRDHQLTGGPSGHAQRLDAGGGGEPTAGLRLEAADRQNGASLLGRRDQ